MASKFDKLVSTLLENLDDDPTTMGDEGASDYEVTQLILDAHLAISNALQKVEDSDNASAAEAFEEASSLISDLLQDLQATDSEEESDVSISDKSINDLVDLAHEKVSIARENCDEDDAMYTDLGTILDSIEGLYEVIDEEPSEDLSDEALSDAPNPDDYDQQPPVEDEVFRKK
jgi:hypothetical protein